MCREGGMRTEVHAHWYRFALAVDVVAHRPGSADAVGAQLLGYRLQWERGDRLTGQLLSQCCR